MSRGGVGVRGEVRVRPFEPGDEPAVLRLLSRALGPGPAGERSAASFRWKHLENPFGRSVMLVALQGDAIVGVRALMRWRFRVGDVAVRALRPVDTATAPEAQGRGVFTRLTAAALEDASAEHDLVFNTPNEKSLGGYLKLGWRRVGVLPVRVDVTRPVAFLRAMPWRGGTDLEPARRPPEVRAERAGDVLSELGTGVAASELVNRLVTEVSPEYLAWRYARAPMTYHAVAERERGVAVFRVRSRGRAWEATLAELFVRPGDVRTARRLVRAVARASGADHVSLAPPHGSTPARAVARRTFRVPGGIVLVARRAAEVSLPLDPFDVASWGVGLGDLEVF